MTAQGGGIGSLHTLGAMVSPGLYYERGLLHPFVDDDVPAPRIADAGAG